MSRKAWLLIIVAVVALGALTLCGVGAAALGYFRLKSSPQTTAPVVSDSGQTQRAPDAQGELRLVGAMPPTLDPALVQDSTSGGYVVHLFSGLVALNAELEVVPALAERWELSADGRTLTFYLRADAAFGDGAPIRADDVVGSLERACSPALGSAVALSYLGDIVGAEAFARGETPHIAGLTALDERTVQITIDSAKSYFLAKLTYPVAAVVDLDQATREPETWFLDPNPSGPFRLEEITRDKIVLARNERYLARPASIARVTYDLAPGLPVTQYETGEIDITEFGGAEIDRVQDPYNPLHSEYLGQPELSVQYLGFNITQAPFDDPLVRRAFAYAIDRDKLAGLVLNRTALPALTILPPNMPGYAPVTPQSAPSYDPAEARRLLAASSYGSAAKLPPIALTVPGTSAQLGGMERAVLAMVEESLGVKMTVEQVEWADMLNDMNERRFQVYSAGWIADYPDPQNFIDVQFHSGSPQNHTAYANAEVDALLEQARVEQDEAQRMALYQQAELVILNDAPWVPLTHGYAYYLVKPYVQGFQGMGALYPWLCDIVITK